MVKFNTLSSISSADPCFIRSVISAAVAVFFVLWLRFDMSWGGALDIAALASLVSGVVAGLLKRIF